jgi:hypothetical protein
MRMFCRICLTLAALLSTCGASLWAQVPTGTIEGRITDESGAIVPGAVVTIRNRETGASRAVTTDDSGIFQVPLLPAGEYEVRVEAKGFRQLLQQATVNVGNTTTINASLQVGAANEVITVESAVAQLSYDSHTIDGVITRKKIQELPLNGRSFLNLAFLEPGVTVSPGTTSQYNSLFSVSVLGGASDKTAITVDGGNIRNSIEGNTGMNFSQEVVQEFQLSSVNFDLSTGITSTGSVNIVTRSGGNDFHGSGYYFFRDHNMAAYPALVRNPLNPDPFFARRNPGFWFSGPIKKDKLFFFFNYEYINQVQSFTVSPDAPSIRGLAGSYGSPYRGKTLSAKFDYRINASHNVFARYSHDGNQGFGPSGGATLPSNWLRNTNFSDQSVLGVTSSLRANLVNDFRFNYTYWQNRNLFPREQDCPGCLGLGLPQIQIIGTNFTSGNTSNATQGRDLRRFTLLNNTTWQKGTHRVRFGTELERAPGTGFWGFCDPACVQVYSPEIVNGLFNPALPAGAPRLQVPSEIRTNADLLRLPFAGGVIGIGDPSQPPPFQVDKAKLNARYRFFIQDTWRIRPKFTLNYGLAWNFESTLVNRDLPKPSILAPLYGSDLTATNNNYNNFSPSLGFAWNVGNNNKTVIRGGGGIYYETELLWRRLQERAYIGPVGNGRIQYSTSGIPNPLTNLFYTRPGDPLLYDRGPTDFTLGHFLQVMNLALPTIEAQLNSLRRNDLSVRNMDISKQAAQLYPKNYPVQKGLHMNLGVQRELRNDLVVSVDFVRRVFVNTLLGELDYNRFQRRINGVRTPVIPQCVGAQANNPAAACSTGAMTFWTPGGRQVYNAMLVKLDKRLSNRFQFTASYALTDQHGYNGIINMDRWNQSWGPQGARHILNVSGIVELPWNMQLSVISQSSSRGPLGLMVPNVDPDGNGVNSAPLPGIEFNRFNRGLGKADLQKAIDAWNQRYYPNGPPTTAAQFAKDLRGQNIPFLRLPANYQFGDSFSTQDIRVTKFINFGNNERYRLSVFAEMFNLFNVANLSGFNFNLTPDSTGVANQFGQPTQRIPQVFGSGGARALQLGARFQF